MINKLILGTVQLGLDYGINNQLGKPTLDQAFEILTIAYNHGITTLDTAEAYGNSQEVIGNFHRKHPEKTFKVITKLSAKHTLKQGELKSQILKDCSILSVKTLEGYMFHNFQSFKDNNILYDEIILAKKQGIIKQAGISLYDNAEIEDIVVNFSEFDFVQIPFNLFDNELQRLEAIKKARKVGIKIHTRSAFLQGLFFQPTSTLSIKTKSLKPYLDKISSIKSSFNINMGQLALQYAIQKDYIDYVLIGVETTTQLLNNIHNCKEKVEIPHHEINTINIGDTTLLNPSNWN